MSIRSKGQKFANFMTGSPEPRVCTDCGLVETHKHKAPGHLDKTPHKWSVRGAVQGLAKVGTAISFQDHFVLGEPGHAPAATHEMHDGREEYRGSEFQQRRAEARGKISQ